MLYFLYNLTVSILSFPFGKLSDKVGRKQVLTAGYLLFSIVYLGFAFATESVTFIIIFLVYGIFTAMTAGVERALIAEISPIELKGTMLGLHSTIAGIALLPASVICGFLWECVGSAVPFVFGASMSALAAILLMIFFVRRMRNVSSIISKSLYISSVVIISSIFRLPNRSLFPSDYFSIPFHEVTNCNLTNFFIQAAVNHLEHQRNLRLINPPQYSPSLPASATLSDTPTFFYIVHPQGNGSVLKS